MAVALSNVFAAVLMHLLLSFPDGELRTRGDRLTVWAGYALTTVVVIPLYVLRQPDPRLLGLPALACSTPPTSRWSRTSAGRC